MRPEVVSSSLVLVADSRGFETDFSSIIITAFGSGELASWDLNKTSGSRLGK